MSKYSSHLYSPPSQPRSCKSIGHHSLWSADENGDRCVLASGHVPITRTRPVKRQTANGILPPNNLLTIKIAVGRFLPASEIAKMRGPTCGPDLGSDIPDIVATLPRDLFPHTH